MPPVTVRLIEPLALPQVELVTVVLSTSAVGWVIVAEVVAVQPFASVTVTVYVPAGKLVTVLLTAPVFHK